MTRKKAQIVIARKTRQILVEPLYDPCIDLDSLPHNIRPEFYFPWRSLHDSIGFAFCDICRGLRELQHVAAWSTLMLVWDDAVKLESAIRRKRKVPDVLRGWSMPREFPKGWAETISPNFPLDLPGSWQCVHSRAGGLSISVEARRALYVAQYGLLPSPTNPARYLNDDGETRYEEAVIGVRTAVEQLALTISHWNGTARGKERSEIVHGFRRQARMLIHEPILTHASLNVELIWRDAITASGLLWRPANERRILIDGTWIFERLAILSRLATARLGIIPVEFADLSTWSEYADLVSELIDFAGTLMMNQQDIIRPLTEAVGFARKMRNGAKLAMAISIGVPLGQPLPKLPGIDPPNNVDFETAYNRLRITTLAEIQNLAPDRLAFFRSLDDGVKADAPVVAASIAEPITEPAASDPVFPPMEFVDPASNARFNFGGRKLLWELWKLLWTSKFRIEFNDLPNQIEKWKETIVDDAAIVTAIKDLRAFWRDNQRDDLAERITIRARSIGLESAPSKNLP